MAACDRADPADTRNRGIELEAVDIDELTELQAIREDEVDVAVGEADVGGVEGVGELDVEALVGPEVGAGESGYDADDLQKSGAVVAGDFDVGVHGLEELQEDPLSQRSHGGCL